MLKVRENISFSRYMIEAEYLAKRIADYGREHPEVKVASPDTA